MWRNRFSQRLNQTMAENISTLGVPIRGVEDISKRSDSQGTRYALVHEVQGASGSFLQAQDESCRVVFHETTKTDEFNTRLHPSTSDTSVPSEQERQTSIRRSKVRLPRAEVLSTQSNQRYILLKKYEGFVTERKQDSFVARLFENSSDYPVVEAEFDLEELSGTDRRLAVEGTPLVWTIGYHYEGSTVKRESVIYMRRLPPWSEKEMERARKTTQELTRGIRWE